jgi:hypothetical protein
MTLIATEDDARDYFSHHLEQGFPKGFEDIVFDVRCLHLNKKPKGFVKSTKWTGHLLKNISKCSGSFLF